MGKLIGGLLGYSAGGIIGLLLGLFVGHIFDRGLRLVSTGVDLGPVRENFFRSTFELMGCLAKSDGRVSEEEIALTEQLMARLGLTAEHRLEAIAHFRHGTEPEFNVDACLDGFMAAAGAHANLRQMLLTFLLSTAFADQQMDSAENELLRRVAARLGYDQRAFDQLLAMFSAQNGFAPGGRAGSQASLASAYAALGVDEAVSDRELKMAYRRLMKQFHPDKLIAEGLPEDMVRAATERTQDIQGAYERVKDARGL